MSIVICDDPSPPCPKGSRKEGDVRPDYSGLRGFRDHYGIGMLRLGC